MSAASDYREFADYVVEYDDIATAANALRNAQAEIERLREALEQEQADLESILPPRGHEELAQGVYFAHKRVEKALRSEQ